MLEMIIIIIRNKKRCYNRIIICICKFGFTHEKFVTNDANRKFIFFKIH